MNEFVTDNGNGNDNEDTEYIEAPGAGFVILEQIELYDSDILKSVSSSA